MRVFEKANFHKDDVCPICKTNKQESVVLVVIDGTQEGYNAEARQFHLACIELWYSKENNIIYQKIPLAFG